ncbi:MAG: sulfur carrier protein ThiS [Alphaproteobacteria bacterium]|nr:sulfur carrier protein ThiS [Alphaproteobacteria bacterium]
MKITINGQEKTCAAQLDIAALLETEGYAGKLVAVALNGTFIPKSRHKETILNEGSAIEILAPMQGG